MSTTLARRNRSTLPSVFSHDPFGALREEFDQMLSQWFNNSDSFPLKGSFTPMLDLHETDSSYEVKVDLPGIQAEDINVQVMDNVLTIRSCPDYV